MLGAVTMPGTGQDDVVAAPTGTAIGIATLGHPDTLRGTLTQMAVQTVRPSCVLACCAAPENVTGLDGLTTEFVMSSLGLRVQRNAIRIDSAPAAPSFSSAPTS